MKLKTFWHWKDRFHSSNSWAILKIHFLTVAAGSIGIQNIVHLVVASRPLSRNHIHGCEGAADDPILHWCYYIRNVPLLDKTFTVWIQTFAAYFCKNNNTQCNILESIIRLCFIWLIDYKEVVVFSVGKIVQEMLLLEAADEYSSAEVFEQLKFVGAKLLKPIRLYIWMWLNTQLKRLKMHWCAVNVEHKDIMRYEPK